MRGRAIPALGAVLLLTTCGDGADTLFTESEATAAAQSALLTVGDLAEGWTSIRPVEAGDNPIDLPGQCQLLNDPSKDNRSVAEARSDAFINDPESESVTSPSSTQATTRPATASRRCAIRWAPVGRP